MDWVEIFGGAAIASLLLAFAIFIVVGWAHGGKYQMSPSDPALKNEISPFGKKCLMGGVALVLLAIFLGVVAVCLT